MPTRVKLFRRRDDNQLLIVKFNREPFDSKGWIFIVFPAVRTGKVNPLFSPFKSRRVWNIYWLVFVISWKITRK